ncbi:MAG: CoA ester lyase [Sphingomicrobium sp.]
MTHNLFDQRALLFLPASNPRAIAKARASRADLVILDLEDAVKPEDKDFARIAAVDALAELWPMAVAIRINAHGTQWWADDVAALARSNANYAVAPMVESPAAVNAVRENSAKPVIAMIESAAGVLAAPAIARDAAGLFMGVNDLAADLRLPPEAGRGPLTFALQSVILAARAAGKPVFDGVFNRLDDGQGFAAECAAARAMGFDGKTLIHPSQIDPCLAAFAPTDAEIARAERLIAAASGGAERFEGAMVETMHVDAARRMIERARR